MKKTAPVAVSSLYQQSLCGLLPQCPHIIFQVCYNQRCQNIRNIKVYGPNDCSAKCNNHGVRRLLISQHFGALWAMTTWRDCECDPWQVCNHESKCHCNPGWAPPYCDVLQSELPEGMLCLSGCTCKHRQSVYLPLCMLDLLMTMLLVSVFHQDLILEVDFSWTQKQLCSVPMSTNRHSFNGITVHFVSERGDIWNYMLILEL